MRKIRILVVDDSVVIRRMLTDALVVDPLLEVAGSAPNGRIALARIPQVNPDVVTLDIEMPEMDGLETLAAIRKTYPRLPVIMFSTLTERGASATLDALTLGANDYVAKPSNVGSASKAIEAIQQDLVPKIKACCPSLAAAEVFRPRTAPQPSVRTPIPSRLRPSGRVDIVAIGVSTGGPNALSVVLPQLPADFPVPVVIVQHMPPLFTKFLAERLKSKSRITVEEGSQKQFLCPSQAWIAPGDFHMIVERQGTAVRLATHQGPHENSCRPAVDVLFQSVAQVYGPNTLGVVMTGMGKDGLRGAERIKEIGGQVIVQDEASSVVWGMPGFVAGAGLADKVLPLDQLAGEIVRRVCEGRPLRPPVSVMPLPRNS